MRKPVETVETREAGLPDLAFSLLKPAGKTSGGRIVGDIPLDRQAVIDLGLESVIPYFIVDKTRPDQVRSVLTTLSRDVSVIGYRLDVLDDLLADGVLIECLEQLSPIISALRYFVTRPVKDDWTAFQETVFRLRELEHYVKIVQLLGEAFRKTGRSLRSEGLLELRKLTEQALNDPTFGRLVPVLPELLVTIDRLRSITIGVNLNGALQPHEATLLSINSKEFTDNGLYNKIIGREEWQGIAQLHTSRDSDSYANPLMVPLFRDIAQIMNKTVQPIAAALKAFVSINSRLFVKLQDEFLYYLGAVRLIRSLRESGLPMQRPAVLPEEQRDVAANGLYDIALALRMKANAPAGKTDLSSEIVSNDFSMNDDGRIVILTGPNRGGKTTFLQAMGLAQILMQAGMYVPAVSAALSPADGIFTHYPALEIPEKGTGRFGEEAERLRDIFKTATRTSFVLMNESLSSTSMGESLYLAEDLLRVLRTLGCRVVFATHLHQLASDAERINAETDGESRLISMVSTIEEVMEEGRYTIRPTFRIIVGPPAGKSYARELAVRFGISRDQLLRDIRER